MDRDGISMRTTAVIAVLTLLMIIPALPTVAADDPDDDMVSAYVDTTRTGGCPGPWYHTSTYDVGPASVTVRRCGNGGT